MSLAARFSRRYSSNDNVFEVEIILFGIVGRFAGNKKATLTLRKRSYTEETCGRRILFAPGN